MRKPFILYHWALASRRKSIQRHGLQPGKPSRDRSFRPSYLCFSDSPSLAWALSGALTEEDAEWDLWMVWSNRLSELKRRNDLENGRGNPTEYRTEFGIKPNVAWFVATRKHTP